MVGWLIVFIEFSDAKVSEKVESNANKSSLKYEVNFLEISLLIVCHFS
jgi:hypothetical protein